ANSDDVRSGRTFDVVDVERALRLVTRGDEARQDHFRYHRIAYDLVLRILPHRGFAPRDRHHAQCAVEVRHIDRNDGMAPTHFDDGGEDRHGPRGNDGETFTAETVAALARCCWRAEVRIEQAPVVVTRIDAQSAAPEEVIDRIRTVVLGDVEDALVHQS